MEISLRTFDLNLLLVFDAIYTERSISRAAEKLHLSQPTVSNALARLRTQLNDPLFERSGQGMVPTLRAKSLAEPIRQGLAAIGQGLKGHPDFAFAEAERTFVISMPDYAETVMVPRFVDWLSNVAPGIRLHIDPQPPSQRLAKLRDGSIDMALDYFPLQDPAVRNVCALTETLLVLVRRHHPEVSDTLSLETYLSLRHVVFDHQDQTRPMIDLALAKRGLKRTIAMIVPHFLSMPIIVQNTDLICTLPRRMGQFFADHFRLQSYPVPLRTPNFPVYLMWHKHCDEDAGHRWLREQWLSFCQRL